jgi:hypothetical protein
MTVTRRHATRMSTKGQVVLPASLPDATGWQPGQVPGWHATPEAMLLNQAATFPPTARGAAFGVLRPADGRARSLAKMDAAVAIAARARHAGGRY